MNNVNNENNEVAEVVEKVQSPDGIVDVIGLDVLELQGDVTEETAKEYVEKHVKETFDFIEVGDSKFVIRTMVSDLNKVTSRIPEDLEAQDAIPIQVKIAEILKGAGLNVNVDSIEAEAIAEAEAERKVEDEASGE